MKIREASDQGRMPSDVKERRGRPAQSCVSSRGIALVITLIMLSITLVMAVAFLAIARRETTSLATHTDSKTAQLAAETAVASAEAQLVAGMLASYTANGGGVSSNAYNLHLFVSTNYINPNGFSNGLNSVSYTYNGGGPLTPNDLEQNIANLFYLPRVPVFVPTNLSSQPPAYDFRFYLDLNENGQFDPNGMQAVISPNASTPYYTTNGAPTSTFNPPNVLSNFMVGDPEWVGVLEHPDSPHGPNNHFTSRYAFVAIPIGNALDLNYVHNQSQNNTLSTSDGYVRNQGVGSWELNLAAFLADLNTNIWSPKLLPDNLYYGYYAYQTSQKNSGVAFDDARSLLEYRYHKAPLLPAISVFQKAAVNPMFPFNGVDNFGAGPVQTTLDYNRYFLLPPPPGTLVSWSGADNTNHFFTPNDFFDSTKSSAAFVNRLRTAGSGTDTYDRYTYYRMLDQLGTDSSPDDGKLNLNYSNAVVNYTVVSGVSVPTSISIITGAETNLLRWRPLDFFTAASDQMLRTYTAFWYGTTITSFRAFTNTFAVTAPFGITNIPVLVSNRFVYTPAVHRLLQLAANIYDASSNNNFNLPHVFRPIFKCVQNANHDVYIIGYTNVSFVTGPSDPQLAQPWDVTRLANLRQFNKPILDTTGGGAPVNVYGVPWVIGAKKGLPNFNQLELMTAAQVTRKLEIIRSSLNPKTATYTTNQAYIVGVTNLLGVNFWNSYSNAYPRQLRLVVSDFVSMAVNNISGPANSARPVVAWNFTTNVPVPIWPGAAWDAKRAVPPNETPNSYSFVAMNWPMVFQTPLVYDDVGQDFETVSANFEPLKQLGQLNVNMTNYLQAYILDGNNVIDYVQLRDPQVAGGINQGLADPDYRGGNQVHYQWSTNLYGGNPNVTYGVINQLAVSGNPTLAPQAGGQWSTTPTPAGTTAAAEAGFFNGFFEPTFSVNGVSYVNREKQIQAPYTPSRTVYVSYLLQANDPLVHYDASDLNSQVGAQANWYNGKYTNGIWAHSDDPVNVPLPVTPVSPVGGRYQPWGNNGQMAGVAGAVDGNVYNMAYKDSLMWSPENWDFPTNMYPTVGWLGRVHRGTPWQTVYLKSTNILSFINNATRNVPVPGASTWANWTGNLTLNPFQPGYYYDAINSAPQQDFLLFDIFTTRYNDNSVRGTLPVNVGMGRPDGGLAAWSALFSGLAVLSNSAPAVLPGKPVTYTSLIMNPAGLDTTSPLWRIVNDPTNGINATRTNKVWNPAQAFTDAGAMLATPALSIQSPFLNLKGSQSIYGINDEEYEWLPQQIMGLVRGTEQRFVLYCYGQTLRPAPNGTVLTGGQFFQLVTNYQVTAESEVRVVIRVDNANTPHPHAVVESYNVLPPY
jgi:hypothetical protein